MENVSFIAYQYGFCDKTYNKKDHLIYHMKRIHPAINASDSIHVLLTSSESPDFLSRLQKWEMNQVTQIDFRDRKGSYVPENNLITHFNESDKMNKYGW